MEDRGHRQLRHRRHRENIPRDYWFLKEAREEYCKEYYGTEEC
jgi:hypothetical protein